jgi:uncharacterized protein with GYD domain
MLDRRRAVALPMRMSVNFRVAKGPALIPRSSGTSEGYVDRLRARVWRRDRRSRRQRRGIDLEDLPVVRHAFARVRAAVDERAEAGVVASVGSRGDSYDDALAERTIGLYKTALVRRRGPWRGVDDVEIATGSFSLRSSSPRVTLATATASCVRRGLMSKYLIQVSYTPEAWAAMVKKPQSRLEAVRPGVESVGGKFDDAWISFGEYDLVGICDFPDNVSAAAFSVSVASKGAVKALHTTPLMTMDEGVEAMKAAARSSYDPPK